MADGRQERWEETRRAWDEVGERFSDVGRRVSERYRSGRGLAAQAETGKAVSEAVQKVVGELDRAFTSVGDTLRDPESKESLRRAVRTFGQALEATFSELSKGKRKSES